MRFKKLTAILIVCVMSFMMFVITSSTAFATDKVKINGQEYEKGSVVTFICNLKCDDKISGMNVIVKYPSESLEIIKDTVNTPNLSGLAVANVENKGEIRFCATEAGKGLDFSNNTLLISTSFKVSDNAVDGDIVTYFNEIIDMDMVDIAPENYMTDEYVQLGEYDGEIATPGNGEKELKDGASHEAGIPVDDTENNNILFIIVVIIIAVLIIAIAVVSVIIKKQGSGNVVTGDRKQTEDNVVTAGNDFDE